MTLETFHLGDYIAWVQALPVYRPVVPADEIPRNPDERWVALQHDVDLRLDWAVNVARAEHEANIRSCFYVQVGCPHYDIMSADGVAALREIQDLGHNLGLHFDPRRYEAVGDRIIIGVRRDLDILQSLVGRAVTVCAHKPLRSRFDTGLSRPAWMRFPGGPGERYVSDSARGFRNSAVPVLEEPDRYPKIRLNTHPCWWQGLNREEALGAALRIQQLEVERAYDDWANVHAHPGAIDQDARDTMHDHAFKASAA